MPPTVESQAGTRRRTDNGELVNAYDAYRETVRGSRAKAYKGEATGDVSKFLEELQSIYRQVQSESNRDTRVQQADTLSFLEASNLAAINARNIKLADLGQALDQADFVHTVKQFVGSETTGDEPLDEYTANEVFHSHSWLKLGLLAYEVSPKVVPFQFFHGPFGAEKKVRAQRARVANDISQGASTTAQQLQSSDLTAGEDQSTSDLVKSVYTTFSNKREQGPVNFFRFFINPQSFAQSVENLFFTSFLIKDGKLRLFVEAGVPMIQQSTAEQVADLRTSESQETPHHIAGFTYDVWQTLIDQFSITESYLGHRDEHEDTFDMRLDSDDSADDPADDSDS